MGGCTAVDGSCRTVAVAVTIERFKCDVWRKQGSVDSRAVAHTAQVSCCFLMLGKYDSQRIIKVVECWLLK